MIFGKGYSNTGIQHVRTVHIITMYYGSIHTMTDRGLRQGIYLITAATTHHILCKGGHNQCCLCNWYSLAYDVVLSWNF